jgi:hypothetical protein
VQIGDKWVWLHGDKDGQTHTDYPSEGGEAIWSHPLDAHLLASSVHVTQIFLASVRSCHTSSVHIVCQTAPGLAPDFGASLATG